MGEQLSTGSPPPPPPPPAPGSPEAPPSGEVPAPSPSSPSFPPEPGVGGSPRLPLRPVYCTVYCVESDRRASPPPPPPPPPQQQQQPLEGEEGEDGGGGGGRGGNNNNSGVVGGGLEVDVFLLREPFSGLLSGEFGPLLVLPCRVCLEEKALKPLPCCKKAVCEECLKRYLSAQVQVGQADIPCPITECSEHLDETTVLFNLPHDDIIKYKYFLELGRIGSSTKPCPQCKHFTTFRKRGHIPTPTKMENKYKVSMLTRAMD